MRTLLACGIALLPLPALAQQAPARGAPPPAQAAPPQPLPQLIAEPVAMMIAGFDRDGDARVTRAEYDAGLRASFDAIDAARSGTLRYIAFADWAERYLGDRNTLPSPFEADRDGDGQVTLAELAGRFALFFTRFDADGDGTITRAELLTRLPQRAAPEAPGEGRGRGRRR